MYLYLYNNNRIGVKLWKFLYKNIFPDEWDGIDHEWDDNIRDVRGFFEKLDEIDKKYSADKKNVQEHPYKYIIFNADAKLYNKIILNETRKVLIPLFFINIKDRLEDDGKIIFVNLTDAQKEIFKKPNLIYRNYFNIYESEKYPAKYLVLEKKNTITSGGYNKIFNNIKKNNIFCVLIIVLTIILIFTLLNIKAFEIIINYTKYYVQKINNNNLDTKV